MFTNPFRDLIRDAFAPPHPLSDASSPCGGPAACDACAVELLRVEAEPCTLPQMVDGDDRTR